MPDAPLPPIKGEEMPVAQAIQEIHRLACTKTQHDPLCNTVRLLHDDWAALLQERTNR